MSTPEQVMERAYTELTEVATTTALPPVSRGAECAALSALSASDVVTACPVCGHYSAMCRVGQPCHLCILQEQLNGGSR
jgi:hypothetical protein